jgi:hypothetical protein
MKQFGNILILIAALLPAVARAQAPATPAAGDTFWYEPAHEKYAPMDIYKQSAFVGNPGHVKEKQQFDIVTSQQGWLLLRFRATNLQGFVHSSIFRMRRYLPSEGTAGMEAFERASIFDEDPDIIRERLTKAEQAQAAAPTVKLPPWQRYKEKWASTKPEQKKRFVRPLPKTLKGSPAAPSPAPVAPAPPAEAPL